MVSVVAVLSPVPTTVHPALPCPARLRPTPRPRYDHSFRLSLREVRGTLRPRIGETICPTAIQSYKFGRQTTHIGSTGPRNRQINYVSRDGRSTGHMGGVYWCSHLANAAEAAPPTASLPFRPVPAWGFLISAL